MNFDLRTLTSACELWRLPVNFDPCVQVQQGPGARGCCAHLHSDSQGEGRGLLSGGVACCQGGWPVVFLLEKSLYIYSAMISC